MRQDYEFSLSSRLAAPASEVWAHAVNMAGVNRELAPLVRMTHPADVAAIGAQEVPLGQRLFRSWILLFGVVPIDFDDVTFVEFEPGRRFLERSPMLSQREWTHERCVESVEGGCVISDRVRFVPRIGVFGRICLPVYRLVFRLRHRNLRRIFPS